MKRISVPGIPIEIPPIGFGCSSLTGVGKENALRLLGTAFDAGVRHFDVARYYGYGESEGLLGAFIKSCRAQVTITTKFGIDPPKRTGRLRFAMQAGRKIARLLPGARGFLQRRAQEMVKGGGFAVADAQRNLETSLRELGTDHIDFYLLHDYAVPGNPPDDLVKFLTAAVRAGKIRYFGLGTDIENILRALALCPQLCGIVQFENSVLARNGERLPGGGPVHLAITHGALGASFRSMSAFLRVHPGASRDWSAQLGVDCSRDENLSALMLNCAVHTNPGGLVLFSSTKAPHVARNVRAVLDHEVSAAQVDRFARLVARDVIAAAPIASS